MIDARRLRGADAQQKKKEDLKVGRLDGWQKNIKRIVEMMKNAKRPVILAGNGIRAAGAEKEFVKLAEKLKIPVLLTWRASDILEEMHPLYFGRPGSVGQRAANFIQQNADLIITIGARLDLPQTAFDHGNFAKNAKKIVVDIDKNEINKLGFEKIAVNMDAGQFIKAILNQITKTKALNSKQKNKEKIFNKEKKEWREWCSGMRNKYSVPDPESLKSNNKYINTYAFIKELSECLTGKEVIVPGSSGSCAEVTMQTIRVKKGLRILNTPGLGSMGFGLPAGIGACVASGKKTISIIGDGGLQHNIQELETVKCLNIPFKLFILNNNGYGSIRMMQNRHFKGRLVSCDPSSGLTLPRLKKVAKAYDIKYMKITKNTSLKSGIKKTLSGNKPVICEVFVDPMQETIPRVSSKVMPDGKIVSMPMEDLYPFLDRQEFNSNMIAVPEAK